MIVVRGFGEADLAGVVALCRVEGWPTLPANPARSLRALLAPGSVTVVADDDRTVVGFAHALDDGLTAYLAELLVAPTHRGRGLGRQLVLEVAARCGTGRMDLLTDTAEAFYTRLSHRRYTGFRLYPPGPDTTPAVSPGEDSGREREPGGTDGIVSIAGRRRVRAATDADFVACVGIVAGLEEFFTPDVPNRVRHDIDHHHCWVVTEDDVVTGFAILARRFPATAEILWAAVDADRRGTGLGTALVSTILEDLADSGVRVVEVKTLDPSANYPPYAATYAFWLARGFRQIDTINPLPDWPTRNPAAILIATLPSPSELTPTPQAPWHAAPPDVEPASPEETAMTWQEVVVVLDHLDAAGARWWLEGGWGVDALVGTQTRPHRDVDIDLHADDEAVALATLAELGYRIETDWRPNRVELVAPDRGRVDLHPLQFDADGHARQAALDGGHHDFPASYFTSGELHGRRVPCMSIAAQLAFHHGYPPRTVDRHDLAQLHALPPATGGDDLRPSQ